MKSKIEVALDLLEDYLVSDENAHKDIEYKYALLKLARIELDVRKCYDSLEFDHETYSQVIFNKKENSKMKENFITLNIHNVPKTYPCITCDHDDECEPDCERIKEFYKNLLKERKPTTMNKIISALEEARKLDVETTYKDIRVILAKNNAIIDGLLFMINQHYAPVVTNTTNKASGGKC